MKQIEFTCVVPGGVRNTKYLFAAFKSEVLKVSGQIANTPKIWTNDNFHFEGSINMQEVTNLMQVKFSCEVAEEMTSLDILKIVLEEAVVNVIGQKPIKGKLETDNEVYE